MAVIKPGPGPLLFWLVVIVGGFALGYFFIAGQM
jgi:hypothetical protein